jgi:hypothetical protein
MTALVSGPQMYQYYLQSKGQRVGPNGIDPWANYQPWIQQIIKNQNSPGMWYAPEMFTTPAGLACGGNLPLLAWVAPGAAPPAPPIPPATLAAYAYDHLKIPSPTLVVNPAGRNYVSLPSYVWAVPANGGARMPASLWITAASGNNSVTLTATTSQLSLIDSNATVYSPCPPTGSKFPVGHAPRNAGPGTRPDCGLVFTMPSTANTIGASLTYAIKVTGAQVGFNPITVTGQKTVSVAEIQNLNG